MEASQARQAGQTLWNAWKEGQLLDQLPKDCRPQSSADAYQIQREIVELSEDRVGGWKIAATGPAGQKMLNVDTPLAGRLLARTIHSSAARLPLTTNRMRVVEVEFAFRMRAALPSRDAPYSQEEVLSYVDTLHPALELPGSRFFDTKVVGASQLIADNACADLFVLGDASTDAWREIDLSAHPGTLSLNGEVVAEGSGAAVLGDPRIALTWLVNELSIHGEGLEAGEIVTTGTCVPPKKVQPGDHVVGNLGALGSVETHFTE